MSKPIEIKDTLQRQMDIIPLDKLGASITIIGAGAIGSWTSLALAKMGFLNQTVIDFDTVGVENMNSQFYPLYMIGEPKVEALKSMVEMFTGHKLNVINDKYTGAKLTDNIVIAAVDSMEVRREAFLNTDNGMFIDPRMGAEQMHLYALRANADVDKETYMKSWYSDSEALHEKCTAKSTIYCANILSGLVAKTVKNVILKESYPRVLRWDLNGVHAQTAGFECWVKKEV